MMSTLLGVWDDFSLWVSTGINQTVYIIMMCIFGVLGTMGLLGFLKGPKYNKDKKPFLWIPLAICIFMYGLLALFAAAKFA